MTSPWSSDPVHHRITSRGPRGVHLGALAALAVLLAALPLSQAAAHPDLLAQIEDIDRKLQADPDRVDLLARRSDLHRRHGDYETAATDLAAARATGADYPLLDFFEAHLRRETGDPAGAERLLDRFVAAEPQRASGWALRANTRLMLGRPLPAAGDFSTAIETAEPPSPSLYRDRALALVTAGEAHWATAGKTVHDGLEAFSRDPALLALGADIALALGQPSAALAHFERLPGGALQLPDWQARSERLECLQDGAGEACREAARAALRTAAERWLEAITRP